jgi:ferric-dicitrate binding protein FerR (iron transport regulator)
MHRPNDTARTREARAELDRLKEGQGALDTHLGDSLRGRPTIDETDPAEVWGRRVGRGLAVVAGAAAVYWLIENYLR